jgi:type VI secretion system ImpA family protein
MTTSQNDDSLRLASPYLATFVGHDLEALLAPISPFQPAGPSLRGSAVYGEIREARREDDASLPQGAWQFELKRADWARVTALAGESLARQSKDLQLAAWLLEAQINLRGFHALAPCLTLLEQLCERYWDSLWPQAEDGDLEYRGNLFRWLNDKLPPLLRQVALTHSGRPRELTWGDWELAGREQHAAHGHASAEFMAALYATPSQECELARAALAAGLYALDSLQISLDRLFTVEAPGLGALRSLLANIETLLESELGKRGHRVEEYLPAGAEEVVDPDAAAALPPSTPPPATPLAEAIQSREEAYASLARSAEFLLRLEPHSPVPYLVRRAIDWGRLNTVELYQELFVRMNGQISIFDLLGLQQEAEQ